MHPLEDRLLEIARRQQRWATRGTERSCRRRRSTRLSYGARVLRGPAVTGVTARECVRRLVPAPPRRSVRSGRPGRPLLGVACHMKCRRGTCRSDPPPPVPSAEMLTRGIWHHRVPAARFHSALWENFDGESRTPPLRTNHARDGSSPLRRGGTQSLRQAPPASPVAELAAASCHDSVGRPDDRCLQAVSSDNRLRPRKCLNWCWWTSVAAQPVSGSVNPSATTARTWRGPNHAGRHLRRGRPRDRRCFRPRIASVVAYVALMARTGYTHLYLTTGSGACRPAHSGGHHQPRV